MNNLKIKKNDKVVVLSGKDKGKTGQGAGHRSQASARSWSRASTW